VYEGIDITWLETETDENATRSGYRLPSSEEWEYAARFIGKNIPTAGGLASDYIALNHGGHADLTSGYYWTHSQYASGATESYTDVTETRAVAWYDADPDMSIPPLAPGSKVMPVAQKRANQLGLYDMSGNM
jgi:formylglycine-generating enzyme required for sulfatase activity